MDKEIKLTQRTPLPASTFLSRMGFTGGRILWLHLLAGISNWDCSLASAG